MISVVRAPTHALKGLGFQSLLRGRAWVSGCFPAPALERPIDVFSLASMAPLRKLIENVSSCEDFFFLIMVTSIFFPLLTAPYEIISYYIIV